MQVRKGLIECIATGFGCALMLAVSLQLGAGLMLRESLAAAPVKKYHVPVKRRVAPVLRAPIARRIAALPHTAFRAPAAQIYRRPPTSAAPKLASLTPPVTPSVLSPGKPIQLLQKADWSVFRATANGATTCFAATRPKDQVPKLDGRKPAYLYVTSYAADGIKNELTIKLGWQAPAGSEITAMVAGRDYKLAAGRQIAYPPSSRVQRDLLQAMRNGNTLLLRTTNKSDGTVIVRDQFSLLGLAEALHATDAACTEEVAPH